MRRLARLLLLALAACTAPAPPPALAPEPARPGAPLCRIGPDGGPPAEALLADRGIGGTGISAEEGDRGIGGTGIIGVITGFASICVNGLEVQYDQRLMPMPAPGYGLPQGLRVGQLVIIEAGGPDAALQARNLAIRYEVSGPVEQLRGQEGLRVAGQEVRFAPEMAGGRLWQAGDWVAVSGLHQPDGRIIATRIDRRLPGPVALHGVLRRYGAGLRLGALPVPAALAADLAPGQAVSALGRQAGGAIQLESLAPDLLLTDPSRIFPAGTERLVIDGYMGVTTDWLVLGEFRARASGALPGPVRRGVLDARRQGPEGFTAQEWRAPGQGAGWRGATGWNGPGLGGGAALPPAGAGLRPDGRGAMERTLPAGGDLPSPGPVRAPR